MSDAMAQAWLFVAIVFLVVEGVVGTEMYALVFGAGAGVAAAIGFLGGPAWLQVSGFVVTLAGLGTWLATRERSQVPQYEDFIGSTVELLQDIDPNSQGTVLCHGTRWNACLRNDRGLPKGARASVIGRTRLTLLIVPESDEGHSI